jgi:hypothetical protein
MPEDSIGNSNIVPLGSVTREWVGWLVGWLVCFSAVCPLTKLNTTATSRLLALIAWLTTKHYKIFQIQFNAAPQKQ